MKTLVLLRHAKTEQPYSGQKDFDRELKDIGISDAIYKGQVFKQKNINFDLFLSSSAKRTTQTAQLVAEQVGYTLRNIQYNEALYLASTRMMLEQINAISDKFNQVLLIAHNPSVEFIAEYLTGENIGFVNTSGAIGIALEVYSWQEVSQNLGKLLWVDFSKSTRK